MNVPAGRRRAGLGTDLTSDGGPDPRARARPWAPLLEAGDLLVLTGELGAGKTTFTQGLGEGLGVRAGIISPTFVLVRIHPNLPGRAPPGRTGPGARGRVPAGVGRRNR